MAWTHSSKKNPDDAWHAIHGESDFEFGMDFQMICEDCCLKARADLLVLRYERSSLRQRATFRAIGRHHGFGVTSYFRVSHFRQEQQAVARFLSAVQAVLHAMCL